MSENFVSKLGNVEEDTKKFVSEFCKYLSGLDDQFPNAFVFPDLLTEDDKMVSIPMEYDGSKESLFQSLDILDNICTTFGLSRFYHVCEGWRVEPENELPNVRISDNPFRKDVFTVNLITDVGSYTTVYDIIRRKNKRVLKYVYASSDGQSKWDQVLQKERRLPIKNN